ncbi:DUF6492 family protein [Microbacterium sp. GXF7504]
MTAHTRAPTQARILTCSYEGDLEACRILCESIDRFVSDDIDHWVIVPRRDLDRFAPLATERRRIVPTDECFPPGFHQVPMPTARVRRILHLPRRNVYVTPYSAPVRGWIAQQILKIAVAAASEVDVVMHIDSDLAFIRPLGIDDVQRDGLVRLYRHPDRIDLDGHRSWHDAADRLLGVTTRSPERGEYIDQPIMWRASVVRAMTKRITQVAGRPWWVALARTQQFSEYTLYGVFVEEVMGTDAAGHRPDSGSMILARWEDPFTGPEDEARFVAELRPEHALCLIQSTIPTEVEQRRRIFRQVEEAAARPAEERPLY